MKRSITISLLAVMTTLFVGCNHLPRGTAPDREYIFNRFNSIQLNESTANDVLAIIQDQSLDEKLAQDEQTIVSWGQDGGAAIWLNAASFDEAGETVARKYAFVVDEDSPGWNLLHTANSKKMRVEFEFMLPPEFEESDITNESERRKTAINTALKLYIRDMSVVGQKSEHLSSASMLLRQLFNEMSYQLEKNPADFDQIESLSGVQFDHQTLGPARVRMLFNEDEYKVRLKIKVGKSVKSFAKHSDVLAMGKAPTADTELQRKAAQASGEDKQKSNWLNWIQNVGEERRESLSSEEIERIQEMADQADRLAEQELEEMQQTEQDSQEGEDTVEGEQAETEDEQSEQSEETEQAEDQPAEQEQSPQQQDEDESPLEQEDVQEQQEPQADGMPRIESQQPGQEDQTPDQPIVEDSGSEDEEDSGSEDEDADDTE